MRVEILDSVLPTAEVLDQMKADTDGAVCVFDGIVRNNTRGRQTLYLDYEAYREMALTQMQALADQALTNFAVRDLALLHRLGRLHVGESSVLIVVASAHRAAAFDACRWLIDTLKQQVPIWKKGDLPRRRSLGRRRTLPGCSRPQGNNVKRVLMFAYSRHASRRFSSRCNLRQSSPSYCLL